MGKPKNVSRVRARSIEARKPSAVPSARAREYTGRAMLEKIQ